MYMYNTQFQCCTSEAWLFYLTFCPFFCHHHQSSPNHPSLTLSPLGLVNWPKTGLLKTHQALWSDSWRMRMSNIIIMCAHVWGKIRHVFSFVGSFKHLDDYEGGVFDLHLDDYEGGIFTSLPVKSSGRWPWGSSKTTGEGGARPRWKEIQFFLKKYIF